MAQSHDVIGVGWQFPIGIDGRRGIALSSGTNEIEEAIDLILSTPKRLRVMRPEFGCRIHELLFAPINSRTIAAAVQYVEEALGYWEPRISVLDVLAEPDPQADGCLLIYVRYRIKATHDERALVYPFYTIPGE
jgi:uncharacterized protein